LKTGQVLAGLNAVTNRSVHTHDDCFVYSRINKASFC